MENLHKKFIELGRARNKLTNEMLAILPEIYKSGVWRKYAATIVEYAGKFGGISRGVVEKRLRLEKNLEGKPELRAMIKEEGLHKVAVIATLATAETDNFWAETVKNTSKSALVKLGKEIRQKDEPEICRAADEKKTIMITGNALFLFKKLKAKYGLDDEALMEKLLTEADEKVSPGSRNFAASASATAKPSRYIPAAKKHEVLAKTNGRCAYPNCTQPKAVFHHVDRYSQSHSHESVMPLCKEHHEFAHNGLINEKTWHFQLQKPTNPADILYRKHRQEALL